MKLTAYCEFFQYYFENWFTGTYMLYIPLVNKMDFTFQLIFFNKEIFEGLKS